MKAMIALLLAFASVSSLFVSEARAQSFIDLSGLSPYTQYKTFDTEHFHFIYADGYFDFTERAATHLEHAHEIISPLLKWSPRYKTNILVADNADAANGFTAPPLRIGIVLIATPPDVYFSTSYTEDWIKLLVFHEYTHMLNIDATTEWMEALRVMFGDVIRPNSLWPVWMLEGLAVYFETRTSKLGRGRSPYYDSILRAFKNENKLGTHDNFGITLDRIDGDDPIFPSGELPYLFGYHLWNQFAKDQSDSQMGEYSIRSSHRIPYLIEGNLENVTGKNWSDYWQSFLDESNTRLGKQIADVKAKGETTHVQITEADYSVTGGMISPDGKTIAYTEDSDDALAGLYLKDVATGKAKRVVLKAQGVGLGWTSNSRYLIYSTMVRNQTYTFYSDLFAYDTQKEKIIELTHGLRAKDPHVSPDGKQVTFTQVIKGTVFLKLGNLKFDENETPSITEIKTLYEPSKFAIIGTPRFVSNSEVAFSLQEIGKAQSDINFIHTDGSNLRAVIQDGSMNRYPYIFGDWLYFVSDRTGIENVYLTSITSINPRPVTNVITGTILPFTSPTGELYGSLMTSNGYEIVKYNSIAIPNATTAIQDSPAAIAIPTPIPEGFSSISNERFAFPSAPESIPAALTSPDLKITEAMASDYSPWGSLIPREWAPIAIANYNSISGFSILGLALGFDTTGKQEYTFTAGYDFLSKTPDASLYYTFYYFRPRITIGAYAHTNDIATDVNHANYDRNYETSLSLDYPIQWTYSSFDPRIYSYLDWNRTYNISTHAAALTTDYEYTAPFIPGLGTSLTYSNSLRSRNAFMSEEGMDIYGATEGRFNFGTPVWKYLFSWAGYYSVGATHAVLEPHLRWLGSSRITDFNHSNSEAILNGRDPSQIYDRGNVFGLNAIGFRGYTGVSLATRSTGVASADYFFPLQQIFAGSGTLPVFLQQLYGFVFGETAFIPGTVHFGDLYLPSYGGGVSMDTTLLSRVPVRFSLQVQNGTKREAPFYGDTSFFLSVEGGSLL